jgi:cell wall-associated NlpC family hydrolase
VVAQTIHASAASRPVRGVVDGEDLVHTAERYLGVPYRWGGASPKAFDCSGFVQYVFAQYGLSLPRTAHEQAALGDAPPPDDLRPGDLLFFSGGHGAQHVAIYVGGDTIIHASSSGRRVKFDLLSEPGAHSNWFGRRLIAIRRLLPAEGVFMMPLAPEPDAIAEHDPRTTDDSAGAGSGSAH